MTESNAERNVLFAIRQHPDNQGKDQSVIDLAEAAIRASGFVIPLLNVVPEANKTSTLAASERATEGGIAEIVAVQQAPVGHNSEQTLLLAATTYQNNLNSRVYLSELLSAFWTHHRVRMGLTSSDVVVTDCPYSDEDICQFMKIEDPKPGNPDVDIGFYLPKVLATKEGLILLGRGFPEMGSWAFQEGNNIRNGHQHFAWMRVDSSLDAPYRMNKKGELTGLNVDELKKEIKDQHRVGQTVNIYGPSGKLIKTVFDYYPDQGSTWSRLPESLEAGEVVGAYFYSGGSLRVDSRWSRRGRGPGMGGRSFLGA